MSFTPKKLSVAVMVALGAASLAYAQTATTEKTVITGSNIKRVDAETVAPVDVITRDQIERTGLPTVAEVLRNVPANTGGSFSESFSNSFAPGASGVALRGLGQKTTLVLINGRRTSGYGFAQNLQDTFVDLNSIPTSAVERIEVLKDGASAIYGSDAIAGVVNLVLKEGKFSPFLTASGGQYVTGKGYKNDGTTVDLTGGVGIGLGRGSLALFGQFQQRDPTNRAWADPYLVDQSGVADSINPSNGQIVIKRNNMPQPNLHWGDGLEKNTMTFANFRMPLNAAGNSEVYAFGGYSKRVGTGNGYWRYFDSARNWPEIYPNGFLPEFRPDVEDYSVASGVRTNLGGWAVDFGGTYGANSFDYNLRNTLNASLGPSLTTPTAPGADGVLGTADDPGIPNQTSFHAGTLKRNEVLGAINFARAVTLGLPKPVNVAFGFAARRE